MHLGNFLLGIQSFQCWTGPEMIVPLLVSTVKNQEMVYNPKIRRKQHKKNHFLFKHGAPFKMAKKFCLFFYLLNMSNYIQNMRFEKGVGKKEIYL